MENVISVEFFTKNNSSVLVKLNNGSAFIFELPITDAIYKDYVNACIDDGSILPYKEPLKEIVDFVTPSEIRYFDEEKTNISLTLPNGRILITSYPDIREEFINFSDYIKDSVDSETILPYASKTEPVANNVVSISYVDDKKQVVCLTLDDEKKLYVPFPPIDGPYKTYIDQCISNNSISEYVPPVVEITSISAYQAKMALAQAGYYDQIVAMINASNNLLLKVSWETAATFQKNNPLLLSAKQQLGLTDQQMDELFILGNSIE